MENLAAIVLRWASSHFSGRAMDACEAPPRQF
jgi:hypothetical protein